MHRPHTLFFGAHNYHEIQPYVCYILYFFYAFILTYQLHKVYLFKCFLKCWVFLGSYLLRYFSHKTSCRCGLLHSCSFQASCKDTQLGGIQPPPYPWLIYLSFMKEFEWNLLSVQYIAFGWKVVFLCKHLVMRFW